MASDIASGWLVTDSEAGSVLLGRKSWRPLTVGLLAGTLLGMAVTAAVAAGWTRPADSAAEPATVVREWPDRPIPKEWRWERRPIQVDHMWRKPR